MKLKQCKICGKQKTILAKDMCNTCYKREGGPKVNCKKCGEFK